MKPKVIIHKPTKSVYGYLFVDKNGVKERGVCKIQVTIDNFKGRKSALDADIMIGVKPPDANIIGAGCNCGWIGSSGDRKLRRFLASNNLYIRSDAHDTLFEMSDAFDENLLEPTATIPQTVGEIAIIGYGLEGLNSVIVGGQCFDLPMKGYVVAIGISNSEYGDLADSVFQLNYETWDTPEFVEIHPKFTKARSLK